MLARVLPQVMILAVLVAGCAKYQYVLIEPGAGDQVIVPKKRLVVPMEPITYRLGTVDRHLLVRVANPTDEAIRIIGDRSYVVDPEGETHPVGGGTIAPHAYIDLMLPPPPKVYRGYTNYHGGFGWGYGRWHRPYGWGGYGWGYPHGGWYDPWYYEPSTYTVEVYGPCHWDWKTGTVRLHLSYERGEKRFEQTLAVLRRKVN